jgi:hypothetical protein
MIDKLKQKKVTNIVPFNNLFITIIKFILSKCPKICFIFFLCLHLIALYQKQKKLFSIRNRYFKVINILVN